jgi:hypothetical protein
LLGNIALDQDTQSFSNPSVATIGNFLLVSISKYFRKEYIPYDIVMAVLPSFF